MNWKDIIRECGGNICKHSISFEYTIRTRMYMSEKGEYKKINEKKKKNFDTKE